MFLLCTFIKKNIFCSDHTHQNPVLGTAHKDDKTNPATSHQEASHLSDESCDSDTWYNKLLAEFVIHQQFENEPEKVKEYVRIAMRKTIETRDFLVFFKCIYNVPCKMNIYDVFLKIDRASSSYGPIQNSFGKICHDIMSKTRIPITREEEEMRKSFVIEPADKILVEIAKKMHLMSEILIDWENFDIEKLMTVLELYRYLRQELDESECDAAQIIIDYDIKKYNARFTSMIIVKENMNQTQRAGKYIGSNISSTKTLFLWLQNHLEIEKPEPRFVFLEYYGEPPLGVESEYPETDIVPN